MPYVVDTDEDAHQIGLEVEDVLFDARVHVDNTVSADAAVDKDVLTRLFIAKLSLYHRGVADAGLNVFFAVSAAIGDRVTLK